MKIYKDIEQGTEDWYKIRFRKIGGTRSKGLFIKSDNLLLELLSEITEEFTIDEDGFVSAAMARGSDLEPLAMSELIKYTGIDFDLICITIHIRFNDTTLDAELCSTRIKIESSWIHCMYTR